MTPSLNVLCQECHFVINSHGDPEYKYGHGCVPDSTRSHAAVSVAVLSSSVIWNNEQKPLSPVKEMCVFSLCPFLSLGTCLEKKVWISEMEKPSLWQWIRRRFTFAVNQGWGVFILPRVCCLIAFCSYGLCLLSLVCVLWGWIHRGRLPERDGGASSAAALRRPQSCNLRTRQVCRTVCINMCWR